MVGKLLLRGLLVGVLAGIVAFGFAFAFGEPPVDLAIAFEEQMDAVGADAEDALAAEAADEEPVVSRTVQATTGLLTGIVVMSVGLGGMFAILFALANGRVGTLTPSQTSVLLAAIAFVTVSLVPFLKYPASPPASTFDDTIAYRSGVYFVMLALSVVVTLGALFVRRQLIPRYGQWQASMIAGVAYVVVLFVLFLLMPALRETPEGFPADAMWDFRMASIGIHAVIWGVIGVVYGVVVERTMVSDMRPLRRAVAA